MSAVQHYYLGSSCVRCKIGGNISIITKITKYLEILFHNEIQLRVLSPFRFCLTFAVLLSFGRLILSPLLDAGLVNQI